MRAMPSYVTRTVLLVAGMHDNDSREEVARAVERLGGVQQVNVNIYRARAVVLHEPPCTVADLLHAVTEAGYSAVHQESPELAVGADVPTDE
ncbi:MAG: heavy-metal-associated domain-containing protein [Planctomycetes bacterium]|nr:heavy-metal-associated domain-containing protein [Planctomycetota bacterium]